MGDKARWEYPAGWLDRGESALEGAIREWEEETGAKFPKGAKCVGTWIGEDGEFQGFTFSVDHESDIDFGPLDATEISGVSWWDPDDLDDKTVMDYVRDSLDQVGPMLDQAKKASRGYEVTPRSGMVSLDIAPGILPVVPGGVEDHHITIVYLGKDVDDDLFAEVCAIVRAIASTTTGPLTGTLSGLGSFPASNSSDGMVPVFVNPTVPGIESLRAPLNRFNASEHKDFHPHVTLAYVDAGDKLPEPLEQTPVAFTHLTVHRGGQAVHFPFRGCATPQERFAANVIDELRMNAVAAAKSYLTREEVIAAAKGQPCPCCGGSGEHPDTGLECYGCDASGLVDGYTGAVPCDGALGHGAGWTGKSNPLQRRGPHGKWHANPRWEEFHRNADRIVDYYTPLIEQAMAQVIAPDVIQRALVESFGGMVKATVTTPPPKATNPPPANTRVATLSTVPTALTPNQLAALGAATAGFGAAVAGVGTTAATVAGGIVSVTSAAAAAIAILTAAPLVLAVITAVLTPLYADAAVEGASEAAQATRGNIPDDFTPVLRGLPAKWALEVARTQVARVGNAIRTALETGQTFEQARATIAGIIHDVDRAKLIAETEYLRSAALVRNETYRLNGVASLQWLTRNDSKVCRLCLENAAASPQPAVSPNWPNGPLPTHPGDRCVIAPA